MRRFLFMLCCIASVMKGYADGEIPALSIATVDGTRTIALRDIVSIKYDGDDMLVTQYSSKQNYHIDTVTELLFTTIVDDGSHTAVQKTEVVSGDVVLYDLNGRAVYSGNASDMPLQLHGIYLMKKGADTVKIVK